LRNRILEIAEQAARLHVKRHQLIIDMAGSSASVPMEDLAVLVVAHPQVTFTQAVLNELMCAGGAFVTCNEQRMPSGLLLPMDGNVVQTERFRLQIELSEPRRKQLWQQIVRAKVRMQSQLLHERFGADQGLSQLLPAIRSGDPANIEAQAARRYWTALFGSDFRRDRDAAGHNALLNYGYAVLRATVSRALVAAGLHPTVGLHHHNRYNAFCLADDVMEPYRPLVDRSVACLMDDVDEVPELSQTVRGELIQSLLGHLRLEGEVRTLFDSLSRTAASLVQCIGGELRQLVLPEGFADASAIC